MSSNAPEWLEGLRPICTPRLEQLSNYSRQMAWHVDIELTAWKVPEERTLSRKDTWNGKALVVAEHPAIEFSIGEVEIAERLRRTFPDFQSCWTAGWNTPSPPKQWSNWVLSPEARKREKWLLKLDRDIRDSETLLSTNNKGRPDTISWNTEGETVFCVEYKGPSPSKPSAIDKIRAKQDAWICAATKLGLVESGNYAVARWKPSLENQILLRKQAQSRASKHR